MLIRRLLIHASQSLRWLYALFVAIDANFRLKRRMVSKDSTDPGLSHGWAYFVDETAYKAYLQDHAGTPQEVSHSMTRCDSL